MKKRSEIKKRRFFFFYFEVGGFDSAITIDETALSIEENKIKTMPEFHHLAISNPLFHHSGSPKLINR